jgi:hypothetical protein
MPDSIPAPWWIFEILGNLLFLVHILIINAALGGSLIALAARFSGAWKGFMEDFYSSVATKIPTTFALGINFGVAPLLFLQVVYGHLFYTSSILMAVFWILVIPLLIIAYYSAYYHATVFSSKKKYSLIALLISTVILLYVGFIFVNNITLMLQPGSWSAYLSRKGGTILNLSDPTVYPRYLHIVVASIAVAGLFNSIVWSFRGKRFGEQTEQKVKTGLRIFAYATLVQYAVGIWFLIALPKDIMLLFMGQNMLYSIVLILGISLSIFAVVGAFQGKLNTTLWFLGGTMVFMVIIRAFLRAGYFRDLFNPASLTIEPQYSIFLLFLLILVIGLICIRYIFSLVEKDKREAVS